MDELKAALSRVETLIRILLARAVAMLTAARATLRNIPNDNTRRDVASARINFPHPILVRTLFMAKDKTTGNCMWSEFRNEVNGDPAAPTILATQNEFQFIQPGFANPPTFTITTSGDGLSLVAQAANPVAGNPTLDVEATISIQVSEAG